MNKIYCGVDVGKNGGIAIIYPDGSIETYVTPTTGSASSKEINKQAIKDLFERMMDGYLVTVVLEDVHSIFGVGAKSNFQFGRALGILEGMMEAMNLPYVKVTPKTWQKVCFEGVPMMKKAGAPAEGRGGTDTKAMALVAAQRLYPKHDLRKSAQAEKAHNGIVDALLMAHYCKLKHK